MKKDSDSRCLKLDLFLEEVQERNHKDANILQAHFYYKRTIFIICKTLVRKATFMPPSTRSFKLIRLSIDESI